MPNVPANVVGQPSNWYPLLNTTGGSAVIGTGVPEGINWACAALSSSSASSKAQNELARRDRLQRTALDNAVDDAIFQRLVGFQNVVAIHVARDAVHRLAGSIRQNLIQRFTHAQDLP